MINTLEPRSIGELTSADKNYRFFIPSYQRGYRWGKEEVTALLNDFLEFHSFSVSKKDKYCLQPIVVKELTDGRYEVLDGQQRLTTLFILLSYLSKYDDEINLFSLEYETRVGSRNFLQNLTSEINTENPDYFYISQAYTLICDWFVEHGNTVQRIKRKIADIVLEQVDIIWYQIKDDSNPIDVFTRINIGKIPLTNSELVKAIFLSKNNLQLGLNEKDQKIAETILNNKQSVIALEWDAMQKQLQDNKFWTFLYNKTENNYQTRIDFILDLVTDSPINKIDSLASFNKYYDKIKVVRNDPDTIKQIELTNSSFIESEWLDLKAYFDILLEWYNDKWYNHVIGFLISKNEKIIALLKEYRDLNRQNFKSKLLEKVEVKYLRKPLSKLSYDNSVDRKIMEGILLLHNVVSSLLQPDTSMHFPFDQINTNKWSLEHIYAQNSDELKGKDVLIWIEEHLAFFRKNRRDDDLELNKIIHDLDKLLKDDREKSSNEFMEDFRKVFSDVEIYNANRNGNYSTEEPDTHEDDAYSWVTDDQSIANLTLLDVGSNAYLSNAVFGVKRDKIKELDKEMFYIPNETRKVFFKYYSDTVGHDAFWTITDRQAYVMDIENKVYHLNKLLAI